MLDMTNNQNTFLTFCSFKVLIEGHRGPPVFTGLTNISVALLLLIQLGFLFYFPLTIFHIKSKIKKTPLPFLFTI